MIFVFHLLIKNLNCARGGFFLLLLIEWLFLSCFLLCDKILDSLLFKFITFKFVLNEEVFSGVWHLFSYHKLASFVDLIRLNGLVSVHRGKFWLFIIDPLYLDILVLLPSKVFISGHFFAVLVFLLLFGTFFSFRFWGIVFSSRRILFWLRIYDDALLTFKRLIWHIFVTQILLLFMPICSRIILRISVRSGLILGRMSGSVGVLILCHRVRLWISLVILFVLSPKHLSLPIMLLPRIIWPILSLPLVWLVLKGALVLAISDRTESLTSPVRPLSLIISWVLTILASNKMIWLILTPATKRRKFVFKETRRRRFVWVLLGRVVCGSGRIP